MRTLLFLLLLAPTVALPLAVQIIASGGSPIPIAYSVADTQSNALTCGISRELEVINNTSSLLALGFKDTGVLPSSDYVFILAGPSSGRVFRKDPPDVVVGNNTAVYIRSASGSPITSGTVEISCL